MWNNLAAVWVPTRTQTPSEFRRRIRSICRGSNVLPTYSVCDWADNIGVNNTFVGGELDITTEIETVISSLGVFVDLLGTATTADLVHFDSPANGQLRHLGSSPLEYKVQGQYVIDGDANDEIALKVVVFRDASTSFEDQKTIIRIVNNLQGGRNVGYFTLFF